MTEQEKKLAAHYASHGSMYCAECQRGFNAYWLGRS